LDGSLIPGPVAFIIYIYIYIYIYRERERERGKLTDRNEEFEQSILRKAKQIESIELPVY